MLKVNPRRNDPIGDPLTRKDASRTQLLLVEDAMDDAEALQALLVPMGIEVIATSSAEEALLLLQTRSVDLVVADLGLPGASGIELTRQLRARDRHLPIVLVTGSDSVANVVEALKAGASDYLQQPVAPARLMALIHQLLSADQAV